MLQVVIALVIFIGTAIGNNGFANMFTFNLLGWYTILFVVSFLLLRFAIHFGLRNWALIIWVGLAFASYIGGESFKYSVNSSPVRQEVGVESQVQVQMLRTNGIKTGMVRVTNMSDDFLKEVRIVCRAAYDDGKIIDRTFKTGIGGVLMQKGESKEFSAMSNTTMREFFVNPQTIACSVDYADFSQRVAYDISVASSYKNFKNFFEYTNNGTVPVKNVQIACAMDNQVTRAVVTMPVQQVDMRNETVINPGQTVKYYGVGASPRVGNCKVVNAVAVTK